MELAWAGTEIARAIAPGGSLAVALNVGNPIVAGSRRAGESPAGVAVDLAREFARRMGVEPVFSEHATAAESLAAVRGGAADMGFMAIDPGRSDGVHFTGAYLEIVGSYVVPPDSAVTRNEDIDQAGMDVVVGRDSAYDLFLTRHLKHAALVRVPRSEQVIEIMLQGGHRAGAGIRQQLEAGLPEFPGVRLLDGSFMLIRQAAIIPARRGAPAEAAFDAFIEWARGSGFVQQSLERHGIAGARVAAAP